MITPEHVRSTLDRYFSRHPEERGAAAAFLAALEGGAADLTDRSVLDPGHVVGSAVVVRPDGRVLYLHHVGLDRLVPPGGHCVAEDVTLLDTALRELEEETGIRRDEVSLLSPDPVFVRVHPIPESAVMREGTHHHAAVHYAFRTELSQVRVLQEVEVSRAEWVVPRSIRHRPLRERLTELAGRS